MYQKAYGIIETLAPLHIGASAGDEAGNLNLIFRDQFTQTGIIPGSSIRGRFRADMRQNTNKDILEYWYGKDAESVKQKSTTEDNAKKDAESVKQKSTTEDNTKKDTESVKQKSSTEDNAKKDAESVKQESTTEGIVKFEYASILWLPVYCPNQPVVRVSCPALLKRYQKLTGKQARTFEPYSYYGKKSSKTLFFNLGFLSLEDEDETLKEYMPEEISDARTYLLLVVDDKEISMIHDMALYRQSRVALEENQKKAKGGAFFNVEALPEGTVMIFPIALRKTFNERPVLWKDFVNNADMGTGKEFYFGGLESVGFGRTQVTLKSVEK